MLKTPGDNPPGGPPVLLMLRTGSMNLKVTAIVPKLPPAVDGLGDYGLSLARQLQQSLNCRTNFIVGDPAWSGAEAIEGFLIRQVRRRSPQSLLELLPPEAEAPATLLLHYVGYGYAKRGCPFWLITALERWRQAGPRRRLVTMFHEVYARAPLWHWNSQFWTSPLQRHLAIRLSRLSDRCLTSKQDYAARVSHLSGGKHPAIPVLPVFSNLGEPQNLAPLSDRRRRLVVFGSAGRRDRVYRQSQLALERTCQELVITEILDIGPPLEKKVPTINGLEIQGLGIQTAAESSRLLAAAIVGFFNYPIDYLAKSGIFAAYCAHGVIPIGTGSLGQDRDGLLAGRHYWLAAQYPQPMDLAAGQVVANHAYAWYQTHSLSLQAKVFGDELFADF